MSGNKKKYVNIQFLYMPNFQKIIDVLSNAFSVLDFSFIISGMCSFLIIVYDLYCHDIFFFVENITLTVACGVFFAYVCGLFSWFIGKFIRYRFHKKEKSFNETYKRAMDFVDNFHWLEKMEVMKNMNSGKEEAYSFMWTELEKKEAAKDKLSFIRRAWVMRAMFEGLITSCLLGIVVLLDLKCSLGDELTWLTVGVLSALLSFCAYLSAQEAKRCAENQITEVILSYYAYVK